MSLTGHACNCPYCPGNPLRAPTPLFGVAQALGFGVALVTVGSCTHPTSCACTPAAGVTFSTCTYCGGFHCNRVSMSAGA